MDEIKVNCKAADTLDIQDMTLFQGELKTRTDADYEHIKKSILDYGFCAPFFIWEHDGINSVLDGTGRYETLQRMKNAGYDIPLLPVAYIDCKDEATAKKVLLQINSHNGTMTVDSVRDFLGDVEFNFGDITLPGSDSLDFTQQEDGDTKYTSSIKSPVYEITGEEPELSELVNTDKAAELNQKIDSSDIPTEIKTFLHLAAERHNVFDYGKIAEYYAHAAPDVQELMEQSALVIIDYDKAIANGYVKVTQTLNNYMEQTRDED